MRRNVLRFGRAVAFIILVIGIAIGLQVLWPDAHTAWVYLAAFGFATIVVAPIVYFLRPVDAVALRERVAELEAEIERREKQWNAKLNEIVTHLATDHESDLGDAMLEKEAAKAEVRQLKKIVSDLRVQIALLRGEPVESVKPTIPRPGE